MNKTLPKYFFVFTFLFLFGFVSKVQSQCPDLLIVATIPDPPVICEGDSATIIGYGMEVIMIYDNGNLLAWAEDSLTYSTGPLNSSTTYRVVGHTSGCPNQTINVTITIDPPANAGADDQVCDTVYQLNATPPTPSPPVVGSWTYYTTSPGTATFVPDTNSPNAIVTVTAYGVYNFVWTEAGGVCGVNSDTVVIEFIEQPVADAGNDTLLCDTLVYQLDATPSVGTGTWTYSGPGTATFAPNENDSNATVTVTAYGGYNFIWTEVNDICTDSDTVLVEFFEQPVADAGTDTIVCGDFYQLNAIPSVGVGTWTYSGPFGGTATFNPNENDSNAIVTVDVYGVYTFIWTEVNGVCTDSDTVLVEFFEQPVADAGADADTCGLVYILNANPSAGTGTWTYFGPGTAIFVPDENDSNATVTVTAYGEYNFIWTEVNGVCVADSDTVFVEFFEQPVADAGADADACGLVYILNANPSAGTGTWTYFGPGTTTFAPNENDSNATVTVTNYGVYTFIWTEVNGVCFDDDDAEILFKPLPYVDAGDNSTICYGDTITIQGIAEGVYWWDTGDSTLYIDVHPTEITIYYLNAILNNCYAYDSTIVFVNPLPDFILANNLTIEEICAGQVVIFEVLPDNFYEYIFYINDNIVQQGPSNTFETNTLQDKYTLRVYVYDTNGCVDYREWIANMRVIPNAFSPNRDGVNDIFMKGVEMIIINRWGKELYKGTEGWDGTYKGKDVPAGTYFYIIEFKDSKNAIVAHHKGSVLLIR